MLITVIVFFTRLTGPSPRRFKG